MAEKAQSRVKLTFSAEEMDRKESNARRVNKGARNRLRAEQQRVDEQHDLQLTDIKRQVRLLRRELKDIRHTKGQSETPRRKPRQHKHLRTYPNTAAKDLPDGISQGKREETLETGSDPMISRDLGSSLPNLPLISSCVANGSSEERNNGTDTELTEPSDQDPKHTLSDDEKTVQPLKKDKNFASKRFASYPVKTLSRSNLLDVEAVKPSEKMLTRAGRRQSKSEGSLATLDLDSVKNSINRRLSVTTNTSSNNTSNSTTTNNINNPGSSSSPESVVDPTPYMFAPPDGLPRTVYLIPPFEDMFLEAKKARYIRYPRKRLDPVNDPERELDIHEIFDKGKK